MLEYPPEERSWIVANSCVSLDLFFEAMLGVWEYIIVGVSMCHDVGADYMF